FARHAKPFPSDQQISENLTKRFRQIETALDDNFETEKPAAVSGAGSTISTMSQCAPDLPDASSGQSKPDSAQGHRKRNRWAMDAATCGPTERKEAVECFSLLPCSRFCRACSMRQAVTRSARWALRCASMAARSATIRFSSMCPPGWVRGGG